MRAVLGIDAAWTLTQPSGVALAVETAQGWRLNALAPSYQRFHAYANRQICAENRLASGTHPGGSQPDASALLTSCLKSCGRTPDLIAIDMPLSEQPIEGRRWADNAVSKAYGSRQCGTHTPNERRPGLISRDLRKSFEIAGYPLQTIAISPPSLIEVYPHPALVELTKAERRLPYKAMRVRTYWPALTPKERREKLYAQWHSIITLLDREVGGVTHALQELPATASRIQMKSYEDMLDAVVCAWVAICALNGQATPFGDQQSAIWIPTAGVAGATLIESSVRL